MFCSSYRRCRKWRIEPMCCSAERTRAQSNPPRPRRIDRPGEARRGYRCKRLVHGIAGGSREESDNHGEEYPADDGPDDRELVPVHIDGENLRETG